MNRFQLCFQFQLARYTKAKQDKVHEIKRLNANITTIRR